MTDQEVLQVCINMIPFLGKVLGPSCEVIIHDTKDLDHSLVAMCNEMSGRELGNPITDLARELLETQKYTSSDYICNYVGYSRSKEFLSSTFFIKNEDRVIGLLCINKDLSAINRVNNCIEELKEHFNLMIPESTEFTETFDNPVTTLMHTRISEIISKNGVELCAMSKSEKEKLVKKMSEEGILMMKGAVPEIARQLGVSVPTIYRYLNK